MNKYNIVWGALLIASLIGAVILIKAAYANPLNLPNYALSKPAIKEAYSYAKVNSEDLNGLSCNCGCMTDAANHGGRLHSRGLIDCFTKGDINNGGEWDAHAASCGLCYEDALYSKKMYEEGKTKSEIKTLLEEKYTAQIISNDTVYGSMTK